MSTHLLPAPDDETIPVQVVNLPTGRHRVYTRRRADWTRWRRTARYLGRRLKQRARRLASASVRWLRRAPRTFKAAWPEVWPVAVGVWLGASAAIGVWLCVLLVWLNL